MLCGMGVQAVRRGTDRLEAYPLFHRSMFWENMTTAKATTRSRYLR
jgi:hypothetical protein